LSTLAMKAFDMLVPHLSELSKGTPTAGQWHAVSQ
jgi:hypothetical protein